MTTYNLITEPWLPVVDRNGQAIEVGLRDALARAHQLRLLRDPLPTTEFGLHRLLIALVLDIFEPADTRALTALLKVGVFDAAKIDTYFAQWKDRFNLFDPKRPFLQTPFPGGDVAKPLAGLLHPMPSGTNASHFHHTPEDDFAVCPAAAARLLTTIAPFMTAGGAGLAPSINGAPPYYVLLHGETLFETLCLNTCVLDLPLTRGQAGPVSWRDDRPISLDRCTGASLRESLTWRPRRIQLIPGEGGECSLTGLSSPVLIRHMHFGPGASCDFQWRDPACAYTIDDKGPHILRPREGREIWRDAGPLALLEEKDMATDAKFQFARPTLIGQFSEMVKQGRITTTELTLSVYAMRTDLKMKIFEWQRERLALPAPLILRRFFHRTVQEQMDSAGDVAYALRTSIRFVYPREGAGNANANASLAAAAERDFWHALRPRYKDLLNGLAPLTPEQTTDIARALTPWREAVKQAGTVAFEQAIGPLDADADALRRQVLARKLFVGRLAFALATPEEKAARKAKRKAKAAAA